MYHAGLEMTKQCTIDKYIQINNVLNDNDPELGDAGICGI